jgi:hypothetical protein
MEIPLVALLLAACASKTAEPITPANTAQPTSVSTQTTQSVRRWRVYDGDLVILEMADEPGLLSSTAPPPPTGHVAMHPWLTASALDAAHEDQLKRLLDQSNSVAEFIRALDAAGFRVVAE